MLEIKQCLWCGQDYIEGMDGCCRSCWEKNQFARNNNGESEEEFLNRKEVEFEEDK